MYFYLKKMLFGFERIFDMLRLLLDLILFGNLKNIKENSNKLANQH